MGFQGQLNSVNLTDIFQTLNMNRQSGTLSVTGPTSVLHVYFESGSISLVSAQPVGGMPYLVSTLLRKGLIDANGAERVNQQLANGNLQPRQAIQASGLIGDTELNEICIWCGEELVCPIFDWHDGEFVFSDGAPARELSGANVVEMGPGGMQSTALLLEASRRNDEWKRIHEVITDENALYIVDQHGRDQLANVQADPDMLQVLRFLDGQRSLDSIAQSAGLSRFDTFAITAQLSLAGVARTRTPEEVLNEALTLRSQGDATTAYELLERILLSHNVPEILRPLAELSIELKKAPRAVELYLELIQLSQDEGNLDQVLADLDTVLVISPDDPDMQLDRAKVLSEIGRSEEAAAAYSSAAQTLLAGRDISRAIDACHRAKNLLPRSPEPHRFLAKAYILDGQTENALAEYKALWHSLLSITSPRKALDTFKDVLESDCRFNGVKEQALNHAQNSEAIKTNRAFRGLIYLTCTIVLIVGGYVGWKFYIENVVTTNANNAISAFHTSMPARLSAIEHLALRDDLSKIRSNYASLTSIVDQVDGLLKDVNQDFENKADQALLTANALLDGSQFEKAKAAYKDVSRIFPGTLAAGIALSQQEKVRQRSAAAQARLEVGDAKILWNNLDWAGAIAKLRQLEGKKDLPSDAQEEIHAQLSEWTTKAANSQNLFERAETIEKSGRKKDALKAYALAAAAHGEAHAQRAKENVARLELTLAREQGDEMRQAFDRGNDRSAFQSLDALEDMAKSASSPVVTDYLSRVGLPYTLKIDAHQTALTIKRGTSAPQIIRASAETRGPWSYPLFYAPSESITVEARRTGFAPFTLVINAKGRRSSADIQLKRGPLWQTEIDGIPITTPYLAGKFLVVGTDRATLEVIDPSQGTHHLVPFPQSVDEFHSSPMLYQNHVWTVLDHRAWAIDLSTRTIAWTWPPLRADNSRRLTGSFHIQDHELIPGQSLLALAGAKGQLHVLAIDKGKAIPYPSMTLNDDFTGALVGAQVEANHTLIYAPTGNNVQVLDMATVSEHQAPTRLYTIKTRGDIVGTLTPAIVAGRRALLAIDSSGLLVALAIAGADVPEDQRAISSWAIEGTGVDRAVVSGTHAYISTAEGRVVAADLDKPGQISWIFPAQSPMPPVAGAPAVGRHGIYVVDTSGSLHCLDPETGAERWRTEVGSQVLTGILALDNRLYIPTRSGTIVCFEEGDE